MGRLGGCVTLALSMTNLDTSQNFSVRMPISRPCRQSRDMTTSSMGTLPARSPRPVMVVCATEAPACSAASVLATPRPKSWWQWISTGFFEALDHLLDDMVHGVGSAAAHGVGQGESVHVAFGGDSLDDVEEAIDFGARGVDGEEDGVQAGFLGGAGGIDGRLHGAIEGPAVGVLDHVVAGGNFDHHAGTAAGLDHPDLFWNAASESEDLDFRPSAAIS